MAGSIQEQIVEVFDDWGKELELDLKYAVDNLKDDKGRSINHSGGQTTELSGSINWKTLNTGGVITGSLTMSNHWKNVEFGRRPNSTPPPSSAIDKFIRQKNLPVDKILLDINARHKGIGKSLNGKKISKKNLKSLKGKQNFDWKVKTLSFLIARSIGKKGIKPRPFYYKVVTDERIQELKDKLAPIIKKQYTLDLTNGINNTK